MARKKVPLQIYLDPEKLELLKIVAEKIQVPVAELVRQGLDAVLIREQSTPGSKIDTHVRKTLELVLRKDVEKKIAAEADRRQISFAECVEAILNRAIAEQQFYLD
jgi:hypothetical protein